MDTISRSFTNTVTVVGFKEVKVEGHRGISSYSNSEIVLRINGGKISIKGENLTLTEVNGEEVFIKGDIVAVERCKNENTRRVL